MWPLQRRKREMKEEQLSQKGSTKLLGGQETGTTNRPNSSPFPSFEERNTHTGFHLLGTPQEGFSIGRSTTLVRRHPLSEDMLEKN